MKKRAMKIAFVVPYVPNLIRTRPYNLILHLAALGHEVDVFTVGGSPRDRADAEALRAKCRAVFLYEQPFLRSAWNCALAVPTRRPLQTVYSWQTGLARDLAVRAGGGEYDVVHVEHLRGSRFAAHLKSLHPQVPVVWDSVDCISHLFRQASGQSSSLFGKFVTRFDLSRTEREEGRLLSCFDYVLVTSPADRAALLELAPRGAAVSPVTVLPNGVDQAYFQPNPSVVREPASVVFTGKISYHANVSMVKFLAAEIMPRVWESRPDVCLYIVGKDPPADIRSLAQDPRITVTGTLEDIRPYLWKATLAAAPLIYSVGIQNKVLEAMAVGTPVVTSPRALGALGSGAEKGLLTAEDAAGFARAILRLLDDPALQRRLGQDGLEYVRRDHDWAVIASRLADIYAEARTDRVSVSQ